MPVDASTTQKADQIAHRFFSKFALVVDNARIPDERREISKTDKWFNLETPDIEVYKDPLRIYRTISSQPLPPPLELQLLLVIPELTNNQVLVQNSPNSSRAQVEPTPTHILLESWLCCFIPSESSSSDVAGPSSGELALAGDVALPTVYKHSISVFRSLYTLLRVLPAWKLCKRLRRRVGGTSSLWTDLRVRFGDVAEDPNLNILRFDTPLSRIHGPASSAEHVFAPVSHPFGSLTVSVRYLTEPSFAIDSRESLLSSHLISQAWDGANAFTPTLASARSREREGLSGIGSGLGSLPARMSLPRSPPRQVPGSNVGGGVSGFNVGGAGFGSGGGVGGSSSSGREASSSIAERFVLPLGNASRTSLSSAPNTSPLARMTQLPPTSTVALPTPAQRSSPTVGAGRGTDAATGSAGSGASSTRLSRDDHRSGAPVDLSTISSASARARKESTGRGSNVDLPTAPLAFPQRRPSLNTIHPFKSGTLVPTGSPHSAASSLRHGSPLPTIPARMPTTYDTAGPPSTRAFPTSPGQLLRSPSSPIAPQRPSPPIAGSSLEREKRFSASAALPSSGESAAADQAGIVVPRRKRYSSTFSHRYAATGLAGSDGSAGSGEGQREGGWRERKESERAGGASYLSANPDDDDLSTFVQEIDARAPLGGTSSPVAAQHARQVVRGLSIERGWPSRDRTMSEHNAECSNRASTVSRHGDMREPDSASAQEPRLFQDVRRRTSTNAVGVPESIRERTMSEGSRDAGQLQILARQGGGGTVDEKLRRMKEAFTASLAGIERSRSVGGGADRGKGKEKERNVGAEAKASRRDLPTLPSLGSAPRLTMPGVSTHGRSSSLSDRPQDRPSLTTYHGRNTTEVAGTMTSGTAPSIPPPLSRRSATTPINTAAPADRVVRDYEFSAGARDARNREREQERERDSLRVHRLGALSGSGGSGGSASGSNSNAGSGYASGLVPAPGLSNEAGRTRAASRLSSESGGRSGGSSEFVGGRMEMGP